MTTRADATTSMAIVGAGYVADMYVATLANHPQLKLVGVYDQDVDRTNLYSKRWGAPGYSSLQELLDRCGAEMILNLTNPRSHYEVTKSCLEAGRHVYSEKPLAMAYEEARHLADLADEMGVQLAAAPCSVLSPTAQTLGKAIRDGLIGKVRLVYANFEDGMIAPQMEPWNWENNAGIHWPAKDEFEVGCTYEHAGYVLTWLAAYFGPARRVTSFASCQIPEKGIAVDAMAPDFTVGCIEYDNDVVARVTCGLVAPRDKSIQVIGETGTLTVQNVRNDRGAVFFQPYSSRSFWPRLLKRLPAFERWVSSRYPVSLSDVTSCRRLPLIGTKSGRLVGADKPVDFLRGPAELARQIHTGQNTFLSADLGVHVVEIVEALQHPERFSGCRELNSSFPTEGHSLIPILL